jgi:hypothetical protein
MAPVLGVALLLAIALTTATMVSGMIVSDEEERRRPMVSVSFDFADEVDYKPGYSNQSQVQDDLDRLELKHDGGDPITESSDVYVLSDVPLEADGWTGGT